MTLQRLVLEFKAEELIVRALYRRSLEDGPGPNTKARGKERYQTSSGAAYRTPWRP